MTFDFLKRQLVAKIILPNEHLNNYISCHQDVECGNVKRFLLFVLIMEKNKQLPRWRHFDQYRKRQFKRYLKCLMIFYLFKLVERHERTQRPSVASTFALEKSKNTFILRIHKIVTSLDESDLFIRFDYKYYALIPGTIARDRI